VYAHAHDDPKDRNEERLYSRARRQGESETIYAWTINVRGRQDVQHVTTLDGLRDYSRVMDFARHGPPEFTTLEAKVHNHGLYTHTEGSEHEWSLTWMKVDGAAR